MAKSCRLVAISLVLIPAMAFAQGGNKVQGTVLDENGEPVIGASVMVVGNKGTGTVTDINGNYVLTVPQGTKIRVSYIGYNTEEVKAGTDVKLKPSDTSLNEVVVVGYGSQKKAHLTGSIATVHRD